MLEKEKNVELNEETEEQSNTQIGNVTHPANDTSTKWDLLTLFNNIDVNLIIDSQSIYSYYHTYHQNLILKRTVYNHNYIKNILTNLTSNNFFTAKSPSTSYEASSD
ncbi:hypothetical protein RhiirB3_458181 [Rhizophagus irregularis]|nr:hypothetical protein RhiirB3_458181 [Rhizophagus irregularis]